jgi:hypothetical protein
MYRIETTRDFDRDIKAIDTPTAARIIKKMNGLPDILN